MRTHTRALAFVCFAIFARGASAADVLFDASKRPMAGNADWIIDADAWDLSLPAYPCSGATTESNPGRFPNPPESGIGPSTSETYWTGAISAWAVDLVKAGHHVETLPVTGRISFGDGTNPQDLAQYDLFIVVEPQNPFSTDEKQALLAFVAAGGGLFLVADHETSDRDCDGWDSPGVWNDLTGATSPSATGAFGFWFRVNGSADRGSPDWFDDPVDANVATDPSDPILFGPFGSGAGGLGLFGSTSMATNVADNPSVRAHVWRSGAPHGAGDVTFATASYGSGRVAAIGDSSPADDETGDPSDNLYPGWDRASGGVANREIHLNACHWLLNAAPDTVPPVIESGPGAAARDCTASIEWTTDEPSTSIVEFGPTSGYGSSASTPGYSRVHSVNLTGLTPLAEHHFRVASTDASGNGPTLSADATFSTAAASAPIILTGPAVVAATGTAAFVEWTTDEPGSSEVEYGPTTSYGNVAIGADGVTFHRVAVAPLLPLTSYHARARSSDGCGNGPVVSADLTFTTGPDALDLSGWTIRQANSTQSYAIPQGTHIAAGGYLVVGRSASRVAFEAAHPNMPAATVYLDSNAGGACSSSGCFPQINGGESFELRDDADAIVDGPTVALTTTHAAYQRRTPGDPAGSPSSWSVVAEASANPGQGVGATTGAGVRILEMSDAADFTKEFVELFYDAGPSAPDSIPPSQVTDLEATPLSSSSIRLAWTAVGDDAQSGVAHSYDVRAFSRRILSAADFAAATALAGEPAPASSGSPQQFVVSGLVSDTAYYFAIQVADEAANVSERSGSAAAVTAPEGTNPTAAHLVVAQIRTSGASDDVIEIYNPTADPVTLSAHSIQYLAANGNFGFRVNLPSTDVVDSHGWYLVAANGYAGAGGAEPPRDASLGTNNLSATAGHALLVSKTTNVSGCADPAMLDRVGYGTAASCPEGGAGNAATTPPGGMSISRRPGGESGAGQDSDVNADDLLAPAAPAFHNRSSDPATPPVSLGNVNDTLYLSEDPGATRLHWARAFGAGEYRVYRGTAPDFRSGAPVPWSVVSAPSAVDSEVPTTIFCYVVLASDGNSESDE